MGTPIQLILKNLNHSSCHPSSQIPSHVFLKNTKKKKNLDKYDFEAFKSLSKKWMMSANMWVIKYIVKVCQSWIDPQRKKL